MYEISRNGMKNTKAGVLISNRPNIPATEYTYTSINIPGRDGDIYQETGNIKDITISVPFIFICNPCEWQSRFRVAKKWIMDKADDKLILGDDTEFFYRVKHTIIGDSERKVIESGEFTVDFICDGYQYVIEGENEQSIKDVLYNPYEICHPTYKILGEGECVLRVNNKQMKANVGQNLTINTDLMMAYRTDGMIRNTAVKGDYEDLYLIAGDNSISVTNGFALKIIPNWRCL